MPADDVLRRALLAEETRHHRQVVVVGVDEEPLSVEIKPDTAVDFVVLRKGKRETIKGVKLPEAKPVAEFPAFPVLPDLVPPVAVPGKTKFI